MGISVGCQGLSRVVDKLFADLKGRFVFNFVDDLVVYSPSMEEHRSHVRQVLKSARGGVYPEPRKGSLWGYRNQIFGAFNFWSWGQNTS